MADLIVASGIREQLPDHSVSSDSYDAFDDEVKDLLAEASPRTKENDRKTVQTRDL